MRSADARGRARRRAARPEARCGRSTSSTTSAAAACEGHPRCCSATMRRRCASRAPRRSASAAPPPPSALLVGERSRAPPAARHSGLVDGVFEVLAARGAAERLPAADWSSSSCLAHEALVRSTFRRARALRAAPSSPARPRRPREPGGIVSPGPGRERQHDAEGQLPPAPPGPLTAARHAEHERQGDGAAQATPVRGRAAKPRGEPSNRTTRVTSPYPYSDDGARQPATTTNATTTSHAMVGGSTRRWMLRPMSRKISELATNAAYSQTVFMVTLRDRVHVCGGGRRLPSTMACGDAGDDARHAQPLRLSRNEP